VLLITPIFHIPNEIWTVDINVSNMAQCR